MSEASLIPDKPRTPAEILDIIDRRDVNSLYTKGGLKMSHNRMSGIGQCLLKPVTEEGKKIIDNAIALYERNYDVFREPSLGPPRKYVPVTTLEVDEPATKVSPIPASIDSNSTRVPTGFEGLLGGHRGKRNKSKKPKRRNSRSKRRKTLSKRRR